MRWRCPEHKTLVYFTPGECLLCKNVLEPVPTMPGLLTKVLSDEKTLQLSLELAITLAKRLLR